MMKNQSNEVQNLKKSLQRKVRTKKDSKSLLLELKKDKPFWGAPLEKGHLYQTKRRSGHQAKIDMVIHLGV